MALIKYRQYSQFLFAFSTNDSSISTPVTAISKPYPIMPKALPVRILKTSATRVVAALPTMMISVLTKKDASYLSGQSYQNQ